MVLFGILWDAVYIASAVLGFLEIIEFPDFEAATHCKFAEGVNQARQKMHDMIAGASAITEANSSEYQPLFREF